MKILLVDDHPAILEIVRAVVEQTMCRPDCIVAGSLKRAIQMANSAAPDLVVLDLGLPDSAGVRTLESFRQAHPKARILVFSCAEDRATVLGAVASGADGFVPKTSPTPILAAAIRLVAAGGTYIPQAIGSRRI